MAMVLTSGTLVGAIDGTEKDRKQAGGCTLYDTKRKQHITGTVPIPGNPMAINSTRPERGIKVSILHAIILAAQTYKIKSSMVKI